MKTDNDKSKWCVEFFRKIREELHSIQSKPWYNKLDETYESEYVAWETRCDERKRRRMDDPDGRLQYDLGIKERNDYGLQLDLNTEARDDLKRFLTNFTHLNLRKGSELGAFAYFYDGGVIRGGINLTISWPRKKKPISVQGFLFENRLNLMCVESIWEDEVLRWVDDSFFGISDMILLGDFRSVEQEIQRIEHNNDFRLCIDKMPDKWKEKFFEMDFSPKVKTVDGNPVIEYYKFLIAYGILQVFLYANGESRCKPAFYYKNIIY